MKEESDEKNNDESKFQILSSTFGLFKDYTLNSFKNLSNKIYSFYPFSSEKRKPELNNNNIEQNLNLEDMSKIGIPNNFINQRNNINENELLIHNNSQIKKNIYSFLEKELKINNSKIELKNSNNNQLAQINKYKELKIKIFIHLFASIIIQKYYNIISITSLSIIPILKRLNKYSTENHIKLILENLWNISNKTSKNIFMNISEIITNYIDKILLNEKYTKHALSELISNIQKEIRDKCNFFIYIICEIKKEINNIEGQFYDFNDLKKSMILEYKLRFFYIFNDIILSDLFYSSFVETYEEEINKQIEEIKNSFGEKNEKTFLAIILDIDSYKNKQFIINEENNDNIIEIKKNKDDILMNYQNCLQSIFI